MINRQVFKNMVPTPYIISTQPDLPPFPKLQSRHRAGAHFSNRDLPIVAPHGRLMLRAVRCNK